MRRTCRPTAANRSGRSATAAIRAESTAEGKARGSLGMSAVITNCRGGASAQPHGDVLEHVPQGQHGGLGDAVADRDRAGFAAPPGPVPVEGQEPLDVAAVQLAQADDVLVVGADRGRSTLARVCT